MKILLLNPPAKQQRKIIRNISCSFESKGNYLFQPQDLLQLSASFAPQDECELLDAVATFQTTDDILKIITQNHYDLIIMMMADCLWQEDLQFLKQIREVYPSRLLLAGDAFLEESNRQAASAYAEGYIPHPWFFKVLNFDQSPSYPDLKEVTLGTPRHELFFHSSYRWPFARHKKYSSLFTAWGCPYQCSYCINSAFDFHKRSLTDILQELRHLKKMGIQELYLADRSFGFPANFCKELLEQMKHEQLYFSWSCYFHPAHTDESLLKLMKETGCHTIIVGIEQANFEKLKDHKRFMTHEQLDLLFTLCQKFKIDVCGDFILGLPEQDENDIEKLSELALKLPLSYASFNLFAPLPGTKLRSVLGAQHFDSLGRKEAFSFGKITSEKLVSLRNKAMRRFYLRPTYLFSRLLKIQSLEHFLIQWEEMTELFKKAYVRLSSSPDKQI